MSVGVMAASSSGSTATINPDHHLRFSPSRRERGGGGGGISAVSVRTSAAPPRKGWGSLRCSSPLSSFRARAAVAAGEAAAGGQKSFYELLGIPEGGSTAEIKRAYKEMARRYHPDVCPSPDRTKEYTRRFIEVQEAYETLSDPGRRALYDRDLARGLHLAFSARRRPHHYYNDEVFEEKSEWRNRWQDQVAELKRRSMNSDSRNNLSWGARMRKQREQTCAE